MSDFLPQIPYSFAGIDADVARLKRLFENALRLISWAHCPRPHVLNLACGRADETGSLLQILCPDGQLGSYLGVDLRHAEIQEARKRWKSRAATCENIEFMVADASSIHALPKDTRYDTVFIRHQNYWDAPLVWDQIFQHAMDRLQPQGILMFTSYFDREHELAVAALKTRRANLILTMPHRDSRTLADAPGKSVDRHIAIFSHPSSPWQNPLHANLAH